MNKTINKLLSIALFLFGLSLTTSITLQSIAMTSTLIFALLSNEVRNHIKLSIKEPFVKISLFIYGLFLLGILWTQAPTKDILHMLLKVDIFLITPIIFAIFYQTCYKLSLYRGFALGVMVAVCLSIVSYLFKLNFFTEDGMRFMLNGKLQHLFYGHTYQNYFAGLLSTGLLSIILTQKLATFKRSMYVIAIFFCTFDIFFVIHGRGGQILYILMVLLLLLQWHRRIGLIVSLVIVLVIVPLFVYFSPTVKHGIKMYKSDLSLYQKGDVNTSMGGRWEFHKYSWKIIKDAPLLGHGTGSFNTQYKNETDKTITTNPHNDYLWFGVELGIVGVLALFMFILVTLRESYRLIVPYKYWGVILVVTYTVACFQNSFFTDRITGEAFIVFACCILANNKKSYSNNLQSV